MRTDAEILLRSAIADAGAYLKMILIDSHVQVEVMRALAHAMRVADSIAAQPAGQAAVDPAALRSVADRLREAVAGLGANDFKAWIEETAAELIEFSPHSDAVG
ncbi:MAG TPA: hypothetical protein VM779_05040 [Thermoanaerobaculia bacterium]|nr:hypothetical protein [Thermoanaerobaculia bacterium]